MRSGGAALWRLESMDAQTQPQTERVGLLRHAKGAWLQEGQHPGVLRKRGLGDRT